MPRDGSGTFSPPAGTTATAGTPIESAKYNAFVNDLVTDANTPRPIVAGGTGATTAGAALAALGGQPLDAGLTSIAGLTTAADRMIYTTAADTYAVATLTAAGRAILDDADAAAQRTTLGAQAADATLTSLAGLSLVAGDILYATGADTLVRLPKGTAGQILRMNSGATAPEWASGWNFLPTQATTSGTAFDFSSIPSWANEIVVFIRDSSLSGTNAILVQIGDSGGIEASGYTNTVQLSEAGVISTDSGNTAGFTISGANAANAMTTTVRMYRPDPAVPEWIADAVIRRGGQFALMSGYKTLSATLDRVRVTRTGADTFDGGYVGLGYRA